MVGKCRQHLIEASETYFQHLLFAASVGLMLVAAGMACVIHAIVPAFCEKTASRTVQRLTTLFNDRGGLRGALDDTSGAMTLLGLIALCAPAWGLAIRQPDLPLIIIFAVLAAMIPTAYLWTNPQLEPVNLDA